ncbi:hypothetical protein G6321_00030865 [Bradyrhizobium barranii subsp. barranii]|uniref:Uncharacterized protein n=1 Tax=Bradyrhizobium barranii subsp. barranii TaxID=2823807 RepID=A0A9X9YH33_9BRAD|nr:hypothetical protein [Bradyrhizobium barranii]UGX90238.1 hypothetical protein G6321_00030865 [Bradyrhizobium barranii subsp. barranii]
MPVRRLKPSRVLGVERFSDFDEFRANEVLGLGTSTPLRPREFSLSRAILPLRDGLFVLQRSFARRYEAEIGTDNGVGLVVPLTFHSIANGREVDSSMIAVMRGKAPVKAIEHHPNTYLMLRFNSDMRHRGWADFDTGLAYVRTQDDPMTPCARLSWRCSRWRRHATIPGNSSRSTARSRKRCSPASTPPCCRQAHAAPAPVHSTSTAS